MSFRLHKGPKLLTVFHDSSPTSQRVVSLLQSRYKLAPPPIPNRETSSSSSSSSPAQAYLDSASSPNQSSSSSPFEIEIVEKRKATRDQWDTIGSYLSKHKRSQVEALKDEEGPLVVDWDGQVFQTEEAIEKFLDQITKEGESKRDSGCCII
jgi:hypothetical protein